MILLIVLIVKVILEVKIVNGKVYLSIGQLVEYIDSITGNKIIKNYLFNQIKKLSLRQY